MLFPSVFAWQVDDVADRAVLNQIADMVVDLAVPATPPSTSVRAPAIDVNIDAKDDENYLEPDGEDTTSFLGEVSMHDPENGRAAIDRNTDNVNASDNASSVCASAAGDSPGYTDSKPCLQVNAVDPPSNVDRNEDLDEAASGGERASERERIRCDTPAPP